MFTRHSALVPRPTRLACAAAVLPLLWLAARAAETTPAEYLSDSLSDRIIAVTQQWGELGLNTAVKPQNQPAMKLRIKDKEYAHGLGHHANGEITVGLDGQFKTFSAELGIQWQGGQNVASVIFQIYADDRKLFDSGIVREQDPPRPVTVSVAGANELRLVAGDAGDGITCDCANWADARLTRDPAAPNRSPEPGVDIAPFAHVATWDPKVVAGTKASRVEEIPAEDLFPARELLPAKDGTYLVPVTNRLGCIGLQWDENRRLRQLVLQFGGGAPPPNDSLQLQFWSGESAWQGQWQRLDVAPERVGNRLVWSLGYRTAAQGTQKVRWVFSEAGRQLVLQGLAAFSRARWKTVAVRIEPTQPGLARKANIELYNGILVNPPSDSSYRCAWDGLQPLELEVRSSVAQPCKADRTVLRFQFPETAFGVAIEDLLANDAVYVPHAGVFVTRLPAPVSLDAYRRRIASRSSVLQQVRARPDQDFPQAWAAVHLPVEDTEPTMLSLACDNRKFIVRRDGVLGFDEYRHPDDAPLPGPGFNWLAASQWQLAPRFGGGENRQLGRHLRGGWLPIPETTSQEGNVTYHQTTYVAPASEAVTGEAPWLRERAVCVVEYVVENGGTEPANARLALSLTPRREPQRSAQLQEVPEGLVAVSGDRLLALLDTRPAAPLAVQREPAGVVLSGTLPGGASARCVVWLPAWQVAPADYARLLHQDEAVPRVETYWKAFLEPAMQIEVPDAFLNHIIRASQVHCAIAARNEARGARVAPWIASAFYGPLESEANSIIRGLDLTGHPDFARRSLEYFLAKRNPAGFITTGYTLVGTGEVLWTLGEHYERTRNREWLRRIAPDLVPICQWVIRQRAKTKHFDVRGQKVPEYGLMPPGVTADWNRYACRFFNDAQYCAGLESAGRALADLGDPAAQAILEDARQYRADIARAFSWMQARLPVVPLADGAWVPADPAMLGCFGRVEEFLPGEDGGRTWCYSVEAGAHHLAANRILDPASREVGWMLDWLEDFQFLRSGWPDYPEESNRRDPFNLGGFAKLQPYYCRVAEVYALRDEVKPFIRAYFNTIPSLLNPENLSFCEHFHNYGAWNKTHETGWFLCQTARMFVMERGDELWLAPFVTSHWLEDGMKVVVRQAPTRFGPVSFTLQSAVAKGQLEAVVQLPPQCTARKVVLRLRHPQGKPMQSVAVQGRRHTGLDRGRETIILPLATESMTIQAQY